MRKYTIYSIILIMTVLSVSCQSTPKSVSQDWSEEMFFKQAQQAIDNSQLSTALFYYEVFLVRFPESHARVIAAEYERAILHKKLGVEDLAIQELKRVLESYEKLKYRKFKGLHVQENNDCSEFAAFKSHENCVISAVVYPKIDEFCEIIVKSM